jgi:hypothetical protein
MESSDEQQSTSSGRWALFGKKLPKAEVVFFCQIVIIYTVIIVSIYNLSRSDIDKTLWTSLLSSCLGYLLPNPSIKRDNV